MVGTPATPSCKIQRTSCSTPGGPKVREEKILVTVRVRPLNRREQAMYDLIAWDCLDEHSIIFKNPNHERPATSYVFGMVLHDGSTILLVWFTSFVMFSVEILCRSKVASTINIQ